MKFLYFQRICVLAIGLVFYLALPGAAADQKNDTPVALKLLQHEAEDDDAGAQLLYGLAYLEGRDGLTPDNKKALYWLRRSARAGNAYAQFRLGQLYAEGKGIAKDPAHAVKWWRKAAAKGNSEAEFSLGEALLEGSGVSKDTKKGIAWLERSAQKNNKDAQVALGKLYLEGYAVPRDESRAQNWLARAVDLGSSKAVKLYSMLKKSVDFTLKVYQESSEVLKRRARDGDAKAQYELGIRYESGAWDVEQDNAAALQWISKAAKNGNRVAMLTLADIYQHGDLGVDVDPGKARYWEDKAAAIRTIGSKQ